MLTANVVEVYELLKPKIGEQETKSLLRFIEDRTVFLVRDEMAKGLATKEDVAALKEDIAAVKDDIAAVKKDLARLEMATKEDVAALKEDIAAVKDDIAAVKKDLARLEMATKEDIARLEMATKEDLTRLERTTQEEIVRLDKKIIELNQEVRNLEWRMRIYLVAIGALIVVTNPKVLDLLGKLMGFAP